MNRYARMILVLGVCAIACGAFAGCGSSRRGSPYTRELDTASDPAIARGEQVFAARCHQCHPGGAGGLAPPINDKPLPVALIKTQVRKGLGAMPAFGDAEVSDEDLDAIAKYLKALRSLQ